MSNILNEDEIRFVKRTIKHIRRVQDNMILLEKNLEKLPFKICSLELLKRSLIHDHSKFSEELVDDYVVINKYHRNKRLGLSTEDIEYNSTKKSWLKHQEIERHHLKESQDISSVDICEMCCDLVAIAQEFKEKDYTEYFKDVLIKEKPFLKQFEKEIIFILELLQELNNKEEKNNGKKSN